MPTQKDKAMREFRRTMKWLVALALLMVVASLLFLAAMGELRTHMVIATVLGVFISMMLGCGLFALAFFSDKSGHDDVVTDSTKRNDEPEP